ncbi:MAG: hypothetical protein EOO04_21800, partial [Chitinophagaceae bacterium]
MHNIHQTLPIQLRRSRQLYLWLRIERHSQTSNTHHEQIITVVGCGGDRDKTKRPVMGEAACEYSDRVIFTSDNPRSEDPFQILKDIEAGLNTAARRKAISIADRREAIKTAISLAGPEDILLIAGKGHEKYQDIKGVKHPFDDKQILMELFSMLEK